MAWMTDEPGRTFRLPAWMAHALLLLISAATALTVAACTELVPSPTPTPVPQLQDMVGSGKSATRTLEYDGFSALEIRGPMRVELYYAQDHEVQLLADDNVVDLIRAELQGDTLSLNLPPASYRDTTPRARVGMPSLRRLELAGAAAATLSGFATSQELELTLIGASRVTGRLKNSVVKLSLSEASVAELGGTGTSLGLRASGASQARLGDLLLEQADATLRSVSSAFLNVKGTMNVDLGESSSLYYVGTPKLEQVNISSGGNLVKR